MNREIKFRGKRVATKEWVEGWLFHEQIFDGISGSTDVMVIRDECDGDYIVNENTIGQFTGLTDKSGKEIYEGDIIDIHQTVNGCNLFEIVWDKTRWNARYDTPRLYEYDFEQLMEGELKYPPYEREIEVIGNIHDNQELLK